MNMQNFQQGLGQLGAGLTDQLLPVPGEVASQLDPETVKLLKKQALMQLGLGMLAAKDKGASLGGGIGYALQRSNEIMGQGLGQAYLAKRSKREDERLRLADERTARMETRYDNEARERTLDRATDNARQQTEFNYRKQQDKILNAGREVDNDRMAALADLQMKGGRQDLHQDKMRGILGKHLATLRQKGLKDNDPVVAGLLSRLDALGVNAYTPQAPYDPFAAFGQAGAAAGGGPAPAGGPSLPALDRFYPVP
jgi:hypothetical protein